MSHSVQGRAYTAYYKGHERVLRDQGNAGDLETKWRKEYGTLYRIAGCFGVSNLRLCSGHYLIKDHSKTS